MVILACLLGSLCLPSSRLAAQDNPSEESMAAYADAANFQTGGAFDLAIQAWNGFLSKYPKHPLAPEAAHYLGVCFMQKDEPDYVAASKAFDRALEDPDYELREESLANHGWCLYVSAGDGEQRDQSRLKRSLQVFGKLMTEQPKSPFLDRALFYSGEAAYGLGQAKQAIDFYDRMLALDSAPKSPLRCDALYSRGVAQEELDQFDGAVASYRQLLSSCKRNDLITEVHIRVGDLMILRNSYDDAIKSFEQAYSSTESAEDRSYTLYRKAFALVQADRPAEAASTYDKLLDQYPDSPYAARALLASAQSSYRSGDMDESAERFRSVLQQSDAVAATEAAHWLARIEIGKGRHAQAAEIARRQLKRGAQGPFAMDLRLDLAESLSMDSSTLNESMELFEKAYRDAPGDPLASRALYNAAFSALQINQPAQALQMAREFVREFPRDTLLPDVKFVAAEAELATGKPAEAAETYKNLLASTPKDNPQRPVWLLRAAAACNAAQLHDDTIRLLTDELEALPQPSMRAEAQLLVGHAHLRSGRPEPAITAFDASRAADPQWSRAGEATLMAGQARSQTGNLKGAVSTWTQLIDSQPDSRMADQARYKLAQLESSRQNYDKAVQYYSQILQSDTDRGLIPYAQYGKGWGLMQLQDYEQALRSLDRLLAEHKQHPLRNDATLARGITLRNLGKLQRAAVDLESFLAVPPTGTKLGHALYEMALIDQQRNRPGEAAQKLERLVNEVPDYPSMDKVLYELGWSFQESGNDDAAAKHFTTLISKYPETSLVSEAAYFVGERHYNAQQWDRAAEQFAVAARKAKDEGLSEKAHYRLGWSHFKSGNFNAAEASFQSQADTHRDGALAFDALMMIGECRFKRSDFEKALEGYEVARAQIRDNNDTANSVRDSAERKVRELTYLHGGQCAVQLKSWDEAIGWFDELRERFPTSDYIPQVFYETGFAYQQKGDRDNALKFFQQVAENYRNELGARARFMMGEIHFASRAFDKAIPEFQRVMFGFGAEKAPDRIKNWQAKSGFEAGRCSELLMQQAKTQSGRQRAQKYATGFFDYVIRQHPEHPLAEKSRERMQALTQ